MLASPAATGVKRFAANGYGAPRVPREYWPSSRPSFSVASSLVPSSSKFSDSLPFWSEPLVDVVLSSPLKNDPFTFEPEPDSSKRNGISRAPLLTRTVASHRPLTGCAPARDGKRDHREEHDEQRGQLGGHSNSLKTQKARKV